MDRVSVEGKVIFGYSNLSSEGSRLIEPWEVYLRLVATFDVRVAGRTVYSEDLFPIVEFAIQSQCWSTTASESGKEFVFTSMESEEEGLVWIKRVSSGWQIGSVSQDRDYSETVSLLEVRVALNHLYARLWSEVKATFAVDIAQLFKWKGIPSPNRQTT